MQGASRHPGLSFGGFVATIAAHPDHRRAGHRHDGAGPGYTLPPPSGCGRAMRGNGSSPASCSPLAPAQLLYGLVADRFGRRPHAHRLPRALTRWAASAAAGAAPSYAGPAGRPGAEGFGAAGAQVLVTAVIARLLCRAADGQVNSLSFMVFLAAPIVAPSLGQRAAHHRPLAVDLPRPRALWRAHRILGHLQACPRRSTEQDRRPIALGAFRAAAARTPAQPHVARLHAGGDAAARRLARLYQRRPAGLRRDLPRAQALSRDLRAVRGEHGAGRAHQCPAGRSAMACAG